ncbi:biotin/lipoyl-containing protein [Novipirellula artificiosorum]|uniref:2-oxoglutarate carboxylase large subunit n=1 Tax=Novipirellula artificiosorum TaxID=2528016 RepID=A0A5C6E3F9_9BACT|nr:biotin/lipoyl-containing protein [Novipirellula artificiosorum]TWU42507.1 2-oxoglutarate carboxylase large subunit [Novipirellula artificiosorum]
MSKKQVKFMCTAFRDGFQSVYGSRVFTKDFLPAVEAACDAGIDWFEAGGGARFQSLYFYCNEDAFAMMDAFRATAGKDANLQTLARGVNVVGLESQPSDIIKLHADLFKKHGITSIRNFDALNDVNNLIYSGQCIVDAGLKHQVCVTLMELPPGCEGAHDASFYARTLRQILDAEIPFDSVCFKDASGTAVPSKVYETIKAARKMLPEGTFIHFHTHETAGVSVLANKAALDAGADAIDLSMAPCSGGTCQPDILVMWHALRGSEYDLNVNLDKVREAEAVFKDCMSDYFLPPEATAVEPLIPWSPMPGGALTSNTQMLRDNNIMDKYPEIIAAMSDVVRKGGYGTSVTPVSQFYFQQAFNNVMVGPWKKIAEPYGKMVLGYFGKTPVEPDPEIVALASQQLNLQPTTQKVLELNDADPDKGIEPAKALLEEEGLRITDENIFIAATCKEKGIRYLHGKAEVGVRKIDKGAPPVAQSAQSTASEDASSAKQGPSEYTVTINGEDFFMAFEGDMVTVDGKVYRVALRPEEGKGNEGGAKIEPSTASEANRTQVIAQMPGVVFKVIVGPGDKVREGDPILILEAMKMEMEVSSPVNGTIAEIRFHVGDKVATGQVLATIQ